MPLLIFLSLALSVYLVAHSARAQQNAVLADIAELDRILVSANLLSDADADAATDAAPDAGDANANVEAEAEAEAEEGTFVAPGMPKLAPQPIAARATSPVVRHRAKQTVKLTSAAGWSKKKKNCCFSCCRLLSLCALVQCAVSSFFFPFFFF